MFKCPSLRSSIYKGRCLRERQKTGRGLERQARKILGFVLQYVRTNGDVNCLSRPKPYSCQWAVWPYGYSHRTGTSNSGNLSFPAYMHLPTKLCCRKMLALKTVQFAGRVQQSSPEIPPDLVKCSRAVTNHRGRALQLCEDVLVP